MFKLAILYIMKSYAQIDILSYYLLLLLLLLLFLLLVSTVAAPCFMLNDLLSSTILMKSIVQYLTKVSQS